MTPRSLELATTADLLDELERRFAGVVVYGVRWPTEGDTNHGEAVVKFKGGIPMSLGMCELLKHYILREIEFNDLSVSDL